MVEAVVHGGCGVLYPETFPEDLRPIVRDFYSRFYPLSPIAAQHGQLLNTTLALP